MHITVKYPLLESREILNENIGSRSSDVSSVLLAGMIAGPIGFAIALLLRNTWRKKNQSDGKNSKVKH